MTRLYKLRERFALISRMILEVDTEKKPQAHLDRAKSTQFFRCGIKRRVHCKDTESFGNLEKHDKTIEIVGKTLQNHRTSRQNIA